MPIKRESKRIVNGKPGRKQAGKFDGQPIKKGL
jgi:hypothetical protein